MPLGGVGVTEIHAMFGEVGELVRRRRTIYRAAVECHLGRDLADGLGVGIIDNPAVRSHLGQVLAGTAEFDEDVLVDLGELVEDRYASSIGGHPVRLVTAARADLDLADALKRIDTAVAAGGAAPPGSARLVLAPDECTGTVWETVSAGARSALEVAPELVGDLLPHVALIAVVTATGRSRLGSASLRDYPGLILMPEPGTAMEVAEAIVHEGAHQKFFDLALTHSILGAPTVAASGFRPSWAPAGVPSWPAEQSLAALHAYSCLAAFWSAVVDRGPVVEPHPGSLLSKAAARSAEIGRWLSRHGAAFGVEGRRLIGLLTDGRTAIDGRETVARAEQPWRHALRDLKQPVVVRDCGRWTLVMRFGRPAEIFWVRTDRLADAGLATGAQS